MRMEHRLVNLMRLEEHMKMLMAGTMVLLSPGLSLLLTKALMNLVALLVIRLVGGSH